MKKWYRRPTLRRVAMSTGVEGSTAVESRLFIREIGVVPERSSSFHLPNTSRQITDGEPIHFSNGNRLDILVDEYGG
jgi:hypothetical protein